MNLDCPEHKRIIKIQEQSQLIGEFLEWLQTGQAQKDGKPVELAYMGENYLLPLMETIDTVLARYFHIDLDKIEHEKRPMLALIRGNKFPGDTPKNHI